MFAGFDTTGERVPLGEVALLAPVIPRSKIVCVGRNYRDHAAELGNEVPAEPMLFFKPNTSVIGPGDTIVLPERSRRSSSFEGELAVVIGRIAKNVRSRARARLRLRLHDRQRRHRARPAEDRRAVGAREGLRHLLPARSRDRDRVRRSTARAS